LKVGPTNDNGTKSKKKKNLNAYQEWAKKHKADYLRAWKSKHGTGKVLTIVIDGTKVKLMCLLF
jgi:hypothetical protein